jgi:FkbM family methyltransferase
MNGNGSPAAASTRTVVIDAGGRYGLHPSWKPFRGELHYALFEPDPAEAARLRSKYAGRSADVFVEDVAVAERPGELTINFFRNRAMSSSAERLPISALFRGERGAEVEIVESLTVPTVSIDGYCADRNLAADFLKLDTEGTEFELLRGAEHQLATSILGIRSEVTFDRTFVGKALFGTIHEYMLDRGFFLLNLDYDGRGEYQNEFARIDGRYGILSVTDAIWLRNKESLFAAGAAREANIFKYAAFCFHNNAPDVAIDVLLEGRTAHGAEYSTLRGSALFTHVDVLLHRFFYTLKWVPGQSLRRNEQVYREIFDADMKTMNDFMQSTELNPD